MWLLTRFDFLMMECMLSLEILSISVSSSPFLYFITVDSRGSGGVRAEQPETELDHKVCTNAIEGSLGAT